MELLDYEKKHLELIHGTLAECTVLLRSDGSFPLSSPCSIAAYGSGVRNTVKGGTGSGEVNSRFFVNVEQGLEDAGFTITTKDWLDAYDRTLEQARQQFIKDIKKQARESGAPAYIFCLGKTMKVPEHDIPLSESATVAIYVLARNSGEGDDRKAEKGDVFLTDSEKRDILKLNGMYEKFMLVLNTGGPVDLSGLSEVKNILLLSQLGVETGTALAEILLGRQNPSGKLATTWAAWDDYQKIGDFGNMDDTDYREGIYVGYRYFDSIRKTALFPFGYGLSYTSFDLEPLQATESDGVVTVPVIVRNTGRYIGKETVQLYVSAPQGKLGKPYQDLATFTKTGTLGPSDSQTLELSFDIRDIASFDEEKASYVLEKGKYIVRIGTSSVSTVPVAVIKLDEDASVRKVRNCLGKPGFEDWRPGNLSDEEVPSFIPVINMKAKDIKEETVSYEADYPIDEKIKNLSDEQLALASVGIFSKKGVWGVVGNAGLHVCGVAGESTPPLGDVDFKPLIMPDGPAGLRLDPRFYRDEKGLHSLTSSKIPRYVLDFLPSIVRFFVKKKLQNRKAPRNVREENQYCTAIPIGTAIAQSWNTDLARLYGDIVGTEMEIFKVNTWLAPALNIHRSILCGRNFEYFSEDPLVSGKMAAAITLGVQAHKGKGTTIKHYAANSQETNRYGDSSNASERTLREIYLKGFGICVRESQPKAVMTSYNLINGVHTAQRRDLIEDILRREFGFEGIVMTDWVVDTVIRKDDKYPRVDAAMVAAAGGDLFMPGSQRDADDILNALKEGKISREQLQINITRLYRMGEKLQIQ